MFERADVHDKFFTKYLWSNPRLLIALGVSLFLIGNVIYNPIVGPYFSSAPLDLMDWASAIMFAGLYMVIRLLQRHTRKHTRKAVVKLHKEVMISS
jgi:hypothetical protein